MPRKTTAPDPADDAARSKSARTRERLLNSAAHVLGRKGFAGTRLADIAEHAQVQAPAIYYYYPSREDLIEAVVFAGASAMREHLEQALDALPPGTPPAERIAAAVEAHLRLELELSDYARAVVRNIAQLPEPLARRALVEITAYYDIWRDLVEDLRRAGQLRADVSPSTGRHVVLGALNRSVEWWNPDRGPLEDVIAVAQSMVLHALRP